MSLPSHLTADYEYELPASAIAQAPSSTRGESRVLCVSRDGTGFTEIRAHRIGDLLRPSDLLVLNDTRVVPGRLFGLREDTAGRAEILLLDATADGVTLMLKTRGRPKSGEILALAEGHLRLLLTEALGDGHWRARVVGDVHLDGILARFGRVPLPPYIKRDVMGDPEDATDVERYQTVYAEKPGAAAAPTAGLHLTDDALDAMRERGIAIETVTLHVGSGTFRPVTTVDLRDHPMHTEQIEVTERAARAVAACREREGRVVAVGTTSARVLESAATADGNVKPYRGGTDLFIHPPYAFKVVDALLTNFHAPRSTLLMLVSALIGRERILQAYAEALARGFRFLSYGDAMFLERPTAPHS